MQNQPGYLLDEELEFLPAVPLGGGILPPRRPVLLDGAGSHRRCADVVVAAPHQMLTLPGVSRYAASRSRCSGVASSCVALLDRTTHRRRRTLCAVCCTKTSAASAVTNTAVTARYQTTTVPGSSTVPPRRRPCTCPCETCYLHRRPRRRCGRPAPTDRYRAATTRTSACWRRHMARDDRQSETARVDGSPRTGQGQARLVAGRERKPARPRALSQQRSGSPGAFIPSRQRQARPAPCRSPSLSVHRADGDYPRRCAHMLSPFCPPRGGRRPVRGPGGPLFGAESRRTPGASVGAEMTPRPGALALRDSPARPASAGERLGRKAR